MHEGYFVKHIHVCLRKHTCN